MMVTLSSYSQKLAQKRLEQQMTSTVTVLRGDTGNFDPATFQTSGLINTTTIYTGKARLWSESSSAFNTPDGDLAMLSVSLSLPVSSPELYRDDLVMVTDPHLAGPRAYSVVTRTEGGYFNGSRTYGLQAVGRSREWEGVGQ